MPPPINASDAKLDMSAASEFLNLSRGDQNRACALLKAYRLDLTDEQVKALVERAHKLRSNYGVDPDAWRELFVTYSQLAEAKEPQWIIDRLLHDGEITMLGALPKHGKTWFMLSIAKALLSGSPLFGYPDFRIENPASRVLYLIPEAGIAQVKRRLVLMCLMEYVREGRLFVMPRSLTMVRELGDPRVLKAAEGADVFLDTAVRFITGDENKAADVKPFSESCLNLATIARTVTIAHHAPKAFGDAHQMTLENMLRGSGDLGAMLSNAYGLRQIDKEANRVHVSALAARDDDEALRDFHLEGRPHINNIGDFTMTLKPGEPEELSSYLPRKRRGGRPATSDKDRWVAMAVAKDAQGLSQRQIVEELKGKGYKVSKSGVQAALVKTRQQAGPHQGELDEQFS
jgi:hypothetical protein